MMITFRALDQLENFRPRLRPTIQTQRAADELFHPPARVELVILHERNAVAVGINLKNKKEPEDSWAIKSDLPKNLIVCLTNFGFFFLT